MTNKSANHSLVTSASLSLNQKSNFSEQFEGSLDMKPRITRIVFVHDEYNLGGLRTIEEKLYKELSKQGFSVMVACRDNDLISTNDGSIEVLFHTGYLDLLQRSSELVAQNTQRIILVSFKPNSALVALLLESKINHQVDTNIDIDHFHWVCHSRAFFFSRFHLSNMVSRKTFSLLPSKSTYFMNDAALAAHEEHWSLDLSEYPVLRIVGRESDASHSQIPVITKKIYNKVVPAVRIVSIGRFVSFKGYNLCAAKIVRQLRDQGVFITWDIWGYGPDENAILKSISENEVSDVVRLCGKLAHDHFDATVASYDLFVGMGVAVLEAAKTGTPVILAVENRKDACYGHLHESPLDSVGDQVDGYPERPIGQLISSFASLDHHERTQIGILDCSAAYSREATLSEFTEAIITARSTMPRALSDVIFLRVAKYYLIILNWKRKIKIYLFKLGFM